MQLPISPHKDDALDCFERVAVSVANWKKRDHTILFEGAWDFFHYPASPDHLGLLSSRLASSTFELHRNLEKYLGIRIVLNQHLNAPTAIRLTRQHLESGNPVLITVDGYLWNGHPAFGRLHVDYYLMVTGYNPYTDVLVCYDPMFVTDISSFIPSALDEQSVRICVFEETEEVCDSIKWSEVIIGELQRKKAAKFGQFHYNCFDSIRSFADEVEGASGLSIEFEGFMEQLGNSPIITVLTRVSNGRLKFLRLLRQAEASCGLVDLRPSSELLIKAARSWMTIVNLFLKTVYDPNSDMLVGRMASKIRQVADMEQSIMEELERKLLLKL